MAAGTWPGQRISLGSLALYQSDPGFRTSAINLDHVQTVNQSALVQFIGQIAPQLSMWCVNGWRLRLTVMPSSVGSVIWLLPQEVFMRDVDSKTTP